MRYHLVRVSRNIKTGPIPVSVSSSDTCPEDCKQKNAGCYARFGPLKIFWNRVDRGDAGGNIDQFCKEIAKLPRGILWRHNAAGDLPGKSNTINHVSLKKIVKANERRKGFTYTHKPLSPNNIAAIKHANANGFTINASADTPSDADIAMDHGIPTVVIVPSDSPRGLKTPKGRTIAICPAQLNEAVTCESCQLCQRSVRDFAIGFRAHGRAFRKAERLSKEDIARQALIAQAVKEAHSTL